MISLLILGRGLSLINFLNTDPMQKKTTFTYDGDQLDEHIK